jgi:hypothetical protein
MDDYLNERIQYFTAMRDLAVDTQSFSFCKTRYQYLRELEAFDILGKDELDEFAILLKFEFYSVHNKERAVREYFSYKIRYYENLRK